MNTLTKMRTETVGSAAKTLVSDGKNLADAMYERGVAPCVRLVDTPN